MSKKYEVIITSEAQSDIQNIYSYVAVTLKEPRIADKLTARIYKAAYSLDFSPERHPVVDWEPWHSRNIRKFPVGKSKLTMNCLKCRSSGYFTADRTLKRLSAAKLMIDLTSPVTSIKIPYIFSEHTGQIPYNQNDRTSPRLYGRFHYACP